MDYIDKCKEIRRESFDMVINAGKGHLGGSFSCVEILVSLYYSGILRFNAKDANWEGRDKFVLSKGHSNNSLYVVLSDVGYYDKSELKNYTKDGSFLGGHCDHRTPGIEIITGSLGHGLGVSCGIAKAHKINNNTNMVFTIIGDGESQEGSVWEASLFASQHNLNNLVVFLDRNRLGSEDFTENTAGLDSVEQKWKSFGWEVKSVDGHNVDDILHALEGCRNRDSDKPLMIVANTTKGKGMYCLENTPPSHHHLPKPEEVEKIREHLK